METDAKIQNLLTKYKVAIRDLPPACFENADMSPATLAKIERAQQTHNALVSYCRDIGISAQRVILLSYVKRVVKTTNRLGGQKK